MLFFGWAIMALLLGMSAYALYPHQYFGYLAGILLMLGVFLLGVLDHVATRLQ